MARDIPPTPPGPRGAPGSLAGCMRNLSPTPERPSIQRTASRVPGAALAKIRRCGRIRHRRLYQSRTSTRPQRFALAARAWRCTTWGCWGRKLRENFFDADQPLGGSTKQQGRQRSGFPVPVASGDIQVSLPGNAAWPIHGCSPASSSSDSVEGAGRNHRADPLVVAVPRGDAPRRQSGIHNRGGRHQVAVPRRPPPHRTVFARAAPP